jgi:hypothetical protein
VQFRGWDLNLIVDKRKSRGGSMHPSSGRPRI